jgi:hypothetical protein
MPHDIISAAARQAHGVDGASLMLQAPLLPRPRRLDDPVDQLRRERPGQHTDRDPVRQPPVRRQAFRTIMSHKTVTLPHYLLKQGHWAQSLPYALCPMPYVRTFGPGVPPADLPSLGHNTTRGNTQ